MADNALALVQAKIVEIESQLAKLRVTEGELKKLAGLSARRAIAPGPAKRSRVAVAEKADADLGGSEPKKSVTGRIRDFLAQNTGSSAQAISEGLGVDTRPISFALQALKRRGEVKMKDGEWSLKGRQKKS